MQRLLVIGWDAADWKVINPLLEKGEMPNLARLMSEGVHGNIATIYPPLSPMLWTSIATGKRAHKHGIHGFIEPTEDGMGVRPISNLGRKTKAFWNILNQHGKTSIVAGWWPSHPAEPIRGGMVSNHFPLAAEDNPKKPMQPGAVSPPEIASDLSELRIHPIEITGDIIRLFAPDFRKVDQSKDKSLHDLAGIIAETMSIHAAGTDLMERFEWDLAAIYYSGIDHFSHRFMRYHAGKVRGGGEQETDPAVYTGIVQNAYRYHDVMLGRLLTLAGPECAVMLLSDHGFHSDKLLPDYIPAEAAGPAVEHRHLGIFCLRAPGVPKGQEVFGASVLDIAPTVLHIFGLPAGEDMDGKVLINAFRDQKEIPRIPSWDEVAGEDGRHPPNRQYDSVAAAESLQQLVDLGYVAPLSGDAKENVARAVTENRYNLARACLDAGRPDLGSQILTELIAQDREQGRFHLHLIQCHLFEGDLTGARRLLDDFDRACVDFAPRAADELKRRRAERPDSDLKQDRKKEHVKDRAEMNQRRELAEKASGFVLDRLILRAKLHLAQPGKPEKKQGARQFLEQLEKAGKRNPDLAMFLAEAFTALGDNEKALEFIRRVRRADPENWPAIGLEARVHFNAGRHKEAVDSAVESLALVYLQPRLHYLLGVSFRKLGENERAEHAFRVALSQMPGLAPAHMALARMLRRNPARIAEAGLHMAQANLLRDQAREAKTRAKKEAKTEAKEEVRDLAHSAGLPAFHRWEGSPPADRSRVVTIVSGLPRSGTSMMMQMLAAAGIEPYTDSARAADEDNPRGYFEHKDATRLHQSKDWVPASRGKAVKIVAHLLPHLPPGEEYRIVFMHRDLNEVIASQKTMLQRNRRAGGRITEKNLAAAFTSQLVRVQEWLRRASGVQVLAINYAQALADPDETAARLAAFLGEPFDRARAKQSVEPSLRRQVAPSGGD